MKPMHRVRIGLIGLAWVFLLVMLATTFIHVAGGDGPNANGEVTGNENMPSDPLAELGVAPGNPDQAGQPAAASPSIKPKPRSGAR